MQKNLIHFPFYCFQYFGHLMKFTNQEAGLWIKLLALYVADYDGILPSYEKMYKDCAARTKEDKKALNYILDDVVTVGNEILEIQKALREKRILAGRKGGLN